MKNFVLSKGMKATLVALGLSFATLSPGLAQDVELRIVSASDSNSLDPHSHNNIPAVQLLRQIYEPLVGRGQDLSPIPQLATSWEQVEPTRWRFNLRPDVTFHDGSPFTAADVVFSFARVAKQGSNFRNFVDLVESVEVIDDLTIDIVTVEPDPVLINKIINVAIMSESWATANGAENPFNATEGTEVYSVRNANGTGAFSLASRDTNVRTVLDRYDGWWGADEVEGNVTRYISTPIAAPATRLAALLSGQADVLLDPPLQDLERLQSNGNISVLTSPEIRTMFIAFDYARDELLYSDVKGTNPFRDIRVRQALYQAIDMDAIAARIMQGMATPAAIPFGPGVTAYPADIDVRLPYDPEAAKALLADAGYPNGFGVSLLCPNNRFFNDEAVCTAIVAMWARIGMNVTLDAQPLAQYSPRLQAQDLSMYFQGSGSSTLDGFFPIQQNLMAPTDRPGDGAFNKGGYDNPELNALAAAIRSEVDPEVRTDLIRQAMQLYKDEVVGLPLYHSQIAWAVRDGVHVDIRQDAVLEAKWVVIDQ